MTTSEEISLAFGSMIKDAPDVADRLLRIAQLHRIDAETLAIKWQSLALSQGIDAGTVNSDFLSVLQLQIKESKVAKAAVSSGLVTKRTAAVLDTSDNLDFLLDAPAAKKTPLKAVKVERGQSATRPASALPPTTTTPKREASVGLNKTPTQIKTEPMQDSPSIHKFNDRQVRFKCSNLFNEHVPFAMNEVPLNPVISVLAGQQLHGYRYMYERLTDKGDYLNDRITQLEPIILEAIKKQEASEEEIELSDPTSAHQGVIYAVGRVCSDSIVENSKFNQKSVMFEASKNIGVGTRVMLNLDELLLTDAGVSLFPGQIIGVKEQGTNPTGQEMNVLKIYIPNQLSMVQTTIGTLCNFYNSDNPALPVDVAILSGPYCLDESLRFEPFEETISHFISTTIPDVLILTGPFVDQTHPLILSGDVDDFPDSIFKNNISARLERLTAIKPSVQFILIPSAKDLCLEWVCFPQPPLCSALTPESAKQRRRDLGLDLSNVHLFPNPVQFRINEVLFAISTTDILFHLNSVSYIKQATGIRDNRIRTLATNLLDQRHLYPLFPGKEGVYLELGRPEEMILQARPDVLVLPCVLQAQCSELDGVVWINPGPLTRKQTGGNFVRICVHPLNIDAMKDAQEDQSVTNQVKERCRVDLYKL